MIGLQEMLMQTVGNGIRLLPAWPRDWNATFKLHAPGQTTITGKEEDGKLTELEVDPPKRRMDVIIPESVRQ